jgi:hypothetical protein
MGQMGNAYKIFIEKLVGRRQLERPRRRWEDNIKMNVMEIGRKGVDRIHLAQDRKQWRAVVKAVMNLCVP